MKNPFNSAKKKLLEDGVIESVDGAVAWLTRFSPSFYGGDGIPMTPNRRIFLNTVMTYGRLL